MVEHRDAADVLNRDFLEMRSRVLDLAAALDRIDRAPNPHDEHHHPHPDRRLDQLRQSIEALLVPGPGRAETVQRLFSLEYDRNWRQKNGSTAHRF